MRRPIAHPGRACGWIQTQRTYEINSKAVHTSGHLLVRLAQL